MDDEQFTPKPFDKEDIVEIYAAGSSVATDRILLLLGEVDIDAQSRETSVPVFPGASHRHLITCLGHDVDKAVSTLRQAMADGIIDDKGTFLQHGAGTGGADDAAEGDEA